MDLFKNFLNSTAYYYYPKYLHETSITYTKTEEHGNFLRLHQSWKNLKLEFDLLVESLKENLSEFKIISRASSSNLPCCEIEILLEKTANKKQVVVIYASMFIPFYHLVLLEMDYVNNKIFCCFDIQEDMNRIVSASMRAVLNYHKFPNEILNCQIPELNVYSEFSYFNAFFADSYRITHI